MKNVNKIVLSILILTSAALTGCAGASAGIAVSNIPLENRPYEVIGPAETTVTWWSFDIALLAFPFSHPPVDEAMQELLKQKDGDAMINIRYWTDRMILGPVTRHRFHIQADVVRLGGITNNRRR